MRKKNFLWKKRKNEFENIFYEGKEYKIYKYLCGEKLWIWELKKIQEEELVYTYQAWKESTQKKYKDFDDDQRREFQRFLNQKKRVSEHVVNMVSIIVTVLFTILIANGALDFFKTIRETKGALALCITLIIALIIVFPTISLVVKILNFVLLRAKSKAFFYEDYAQIFREQKLGGDSD